MQLTVTGSPIAGLEIKLDSEAYGIAVEGILGRNSSAWNLVTNDSCVYIGARRLGMGKALARAIEHLESSFVKVQEKQIAARLLNKESSNG